MWVITRISIVVGDGVVLARNSTLSLSFLSQPPHVSPQKLRIATNLAVFYLCCETSGRIVEEGGLVFVHYLFPPPPFQVLIWYWFLYIPIHEP